MRFRHPQNKFGWQIQAKNFGIPGACATSPTEKLIETTLRGFYSLSQENHTQKNAHKLF